MRDTADGQLPQTGQFTRADDNQFGANPGRRFENCTCRRIGDLGRSCHLFHTALCGRALRLVQDGIGLLFRDLFLDIARRTRHRRRIPRAQVGQLHGMKQYQPGVTSLCQLDRGIQCLPGMIRSVESHQNLAEHVAVPCPL